MITVATVLLVGGPNDGEVMHDVRGNSIALPMEINGVPVPRTSQGVYVSRGDIVEGVDQWAWMPRYPEAA